MATQGLALRRALPRDAPALAAVSTPSLRGLDFLPVLHTPAEDRSFLERVILANCAVTIAAGGGRPVAFLARQAAEISLLYTQADAIRRGAGGLLLGAVQRLAAQPLELWYFQANWNEETLPDIRYRWENRT
ncbi:MAG: hypothetical protein AAF713_08125 [Pseudomonadota bacterium]